MNLWLYHFLSSCQLFCLVWVVPWTLVWFLSILKLLLYVQPLLKKPDLDLWDSNNYKPIFNFTFLCEVFEKVIAMEVLEGVEYNIFEKLQSGCRNKQYGAPRGYKEWQCQEYLCVISPWYKCDVWDDPSCCHDQSIKTMGGNIMNGTSLFFVIFI